MAATAVELSLGAVVAAVFRLGDSAKTVESLVRGAAVTMQVVVAGNTRRGAAQGGAPL